MPDIDDRFRFVRLQVAADAHSAARTRTEFRVWLERHFTLGAERFSDLLLAVNEAIANATEFAYADGSRNGTVDVSAAYDDESDTLAVTINDHGRWRDDGSAQRRPERRGRGIPLMRALADEVALDRTSQGTNVTLTWTDLTEPGTRN